MTVSLKNIYVAATEARLKSYKEGPIQVVVNRNGCFDQEINIRFFTIWVRGTCYYMETSSIGGSDDMGRREEVVDLQADLEFEEIQIFAGEDAIYPTGS